MALRSGLTVGLLLFGMALALRQPPLGAAGLAVLALAGLAAAWRRWGMARVAYRRRFAQAGVFPDEPADLWTELENDKLLPLPWIRIQDEIPDQIRLAQGRRGGPVGTRCSELVQMLPLGWFQRVRRHYRLTFPRRGLQVLGPARITAGDPFGLVLLEAQEPALAEVVVYPRLVAQPALGVTARDLARQSLLRRGLLEDPLQVVGLRDYQPGDSLARIDWKATARTGALQSRVYAPPGRPAVAICCNLATFADTFMGFDRDRVETMISVAATLALQALEQQAVGLYANGVAARRGPARLAPDQSPAQAGAILDLLGRLDPMPTQPFAELLAELLPGLARGTAIWVVAARAEPEVMAALAQAVRRGHPMTLLWTGPQTPPQLPPGVSMHLVPEEVTHHALGAGDADQPHPGPGR